MGRVRSHGDGTCQVTWGWDVKQGKGNGIVREGRTKITFMLDMSSQNHRREIMPTFIFRVTSKIPTLDFS